MNSFSRGDIDHKMNVHLACKPAENLSRRCVVTIDSQDGSRDLLGLGAPNWANSYAPETTGRLLEAAGFEWTRRRWPPRSQPARRPNFTCSHSPRRTDQPADRSERPTHRRLGATVEHVAAGR